MRSGNAARHSLPEGVVEEFATLLKSYGISKVIGDRYAGEWPREQFRKHSITYEPSAKPKSDLYRDLLPLINSGKADLLDNPKLTTQLLGLERRTARGGKDSIDHSPGAHDDVVNSVAGALVNATATSGYDRSMVWASDVNDNDTEFHASRLQRHIFQSGGFR